MIVRGSGVMSSDPRSQLSLGCRQLSTNPVMDGIPAGAPEPKCCIAMSSKELAWLRVRQAGAELALRAPDPDLFDRSVRLVPRIGFGHVEPVKALALRVKLPEQGVEGANLEHENDDMFNFWHAPPIDFEDAA